MDFGREMSRLSSPIYREFCLLFLVLLVIYWTFLPFMFCQFSLLGEKNPLTASLSFHSSLFFCVSPLLASACVEYLDHVVKTWFESRPDLFLSSLAHCVIFASLPQEYVGRPINVGHRLLFPRLPLFIVP